MTIENIIKNNTNLIYKIASKFYGVESEDLFQAGVLGLLKAYKNYHSNGTTKFSTYAYEYIYGEMYTLVNNRAMKINKDILKLYRVIEKTRFSLAQKYNRVPNNNEIAAFLELPLGQIEDAILAGKEIMSLDFEQEMPYYETLKVDEKVNLDDQILISEGLELLTSDEKEIIKARYYEDMTQSEIAKKLAMTQVMVSRYEKKGLNKMQQFMSL
ncbi:MAG: sigma-70 family RNA polymerase sigma factor [Firmicutes bacterium]|nr:sigma-70 family RNA polymerase sigma factor [Bacillota bacterium]